MTEVAFPHIANGFRWDLDACQKLVQHVGEFLDDCGRYQTSNTRRSLSIVWQG